MRFTKTLALWSMIVLALQIVTAGNGTVCVSAGASLVINVGISKKSCITSMVNTPPNIIIEIIIAIQSHLKRHNFYCFQFFYLRSFHCVGHT